MPIHSVVIQRILAGKGHYGRKTAEHHFKVYTYGYRNRMMEHDPDKTLICIRNACDFIGNLVRQNARFLFVSTNPFCNEIVDAMIEKIGCRNDNAWRLGGFLTNSTGPRKFRSRNKKMNLPSIHPPDCVVIMDTERKSSVIHEASKLQIPIVGFVDSTMPLETFQKITYPIPANDSIQFRYLFCNLITKTFLYEQKKFPNLRAKEEERPPKEIEEAARPSKIDGANDELFVLPYESLLPVSDDVLETKTSLDKLAVLKINGEVGTSMGFDGPKSTIEVCNGFTCLDLLVSHIESVNSSYGCNIPLLLMNADNTHNGTLKVLEKHLTKNIHTFIQSPDQVGIDAMAVQLGEKNEVEQSYSSNLNRILLSLKSSGKLEVLLSQGKEYILLLDSDNLADVLDPKILNNMIKNDIEYCMEVTSASPNKPEEDAVNPQKPKTQLEKTSKFIKTTNLWLNIKAIDALMKNVSFKENDAISTFIDSAIALNVPQSRSLPLETTSDLLLLQSDLYTCSEGILTRNEARTNPANPSIELGPEFEKVVDFKRRFQSIPSIIELDNLKVTGNVWFGSGVTLKGDVTIASRPFVKLVIPDGAVIENKVIHSVLDI